MLLAYSGGKWFLWPHMEQLQSLARKSIELEISQTKRSIPVRVQDSSAVRLATTDRCILKSRRHSVNSLQRRVPKCHTDNSAGLQASHGDDTLRGLHAGSRPGVEGKTNSVSLVSLSNISNRALHVWWYEKFFLEHWERNANNSAVICKFDEVNGLELDIWLYSYTNNIQREIGIIKQVETRLCKQLNIKLKFEN